MVQMMKHSHPGPGAEEPPPASCPLRSFDKACDGSGTHGLHSRSLLNLNSSSSGRMAQLGLNAWHSLPFVSFLLDSFSEKAGRLALPSPDFSQTKIQA